MWWKAGRWQTAEWWRLVGGVVRQWQAGDRKQELMNTLEAITTLEIRLAQKH